MGTYLAVDFGGGSGRVMAGTIRKDTLVLEEIYRFPNRQIKLGKHLYWDFLSLFEEMKTGIRMAFRKGLAVESIGVDTWGVDFGLIDKAGNLLGNPICYRDSCTEGLPEEVFQQIDEKGHYEEAGIQVMAINSLFQLYARVKENSRVLEQADRLLFMPDLFSFYLTGVVNNEYSIASTSELLKARGRVWNRSLMRQLGIPEHLFGELVMPGTVRGILNKELAAEFGCTSEVKVIAVGSHDTASAVYAIPYEESKKPVSAFLSSGTWSLLGIELDEPILTEEARKAGFTNEGAVGGGSPFSAEHHRTMDFAVPDETMERKRKVYGLRIFDS